jgi:rhamnogalacturonan endolyase
MSGGIEYICVLFSYWKGMINNFSMKNSIDLKTLFNTLVAMTVLLSFSANVRAELEDIGRGVVAVEEASGIYVGWRLLATDPDTAGFNLYRIADGGSGVKLNDEPLKAATNYFDSSAVLTSVNEYYVAAVVDDVEQTASDTVGVWDQNYLTVPLQRPAGGTLPDGDYTYSPNDASVADLDGDGKYEIILKWDPSNSQDNAHDGYTGNMILDAYEMDGTLLWRIDFGINIRSGAHYTPFMVYDLDQDGIAEVAARTAPGSKDATGAFLSEGPAASADHNADYRTSTGRLGRILSGPEYLTVFSGADGTELATIDLEPARGSLSSWGDSYGNRGYRFLGAVAYLDGQNPSLVWCRGIYEKMELAAFDFDGSAITQIWHFKTQEGYSDWAGMGSHNLSVGDLDNDGRDEIAYGNCAIDDDGTGLWTLRSSIGKATGDAMHLADIIPERGGLEKWGCGEGSGPGAHLVDAATGEALWLTAPEDVGRATAGDLTSAFYGMECWGGTDGLRSANNMKAGSKPSSTNHVVWWDADLGRELLDGISISKYPSGSLLEASGCSKNNGSKSNPCLQADIFGDWREEVIWRTSDNSSLRIYTTTIPTEHRIKTLMHDRQYRLAIAWQNNSYNQPPHTSFYLGFEMFSPAEEIPPSAPAGLSLNVGTEFIGLSWTANFESDIAGYNVYKSVAGSAFVLLNDTLINSTSAIDSAIVLDTQYEYYLTAVDTFENESAASVTLQALPTYKPDPPSGLYGRGGYGKALVFWDPVEADDVTGYNVYVSESSGSGYQKLNTGLITDTVYTHSGLDNGKTYYFVVTSVDDAERESFYPEEIPLAPGGPYVLQAEDVELDDVWVENNHSGFHGTGFVNFDASGYVEFKYVYSRFTDWYNMIIRYALGNTSRTGEIQLNGSAFDYTMETTEGWTDYVYDTLKVPLRTGFDNTIRFQATGSDFGNLDEIIIADRTMKPEAVEDFLAEQSLFFYPNPFSSSTRIDLKYTGSGEPRIRIVNVYGQVLKADRFENMGGDRFRYQWNGDGTYPACPGIYFATIFVDDTAWRTVKVILRR